MAHVVAVVAEGVTELGADLIRAVGIALRAARELATRTVLLTTPDVLGLLEGIGLCVGGQVVVVRGKVLEEGRLVHLGTGLARTTVVHEDGELATGRDAWALLGASVARDQTREGDVKVEVVHHVTDTVQKDLCLLAKVGRSGEGLTHRLDGEEGVTLPLAAPEGGLRGTREGLVQHTAGDEIVVGSRHGVEIFWGFVRVKVCYNVTYEKKNRRLSVGSTCHPFSPFFPRISNLCFWSGVRITDIVFESKRGCLGPIHVDTNEIVRMASDSTQPSVLVEVNGSPSVESSHVESCNVASPKAKETLERTEGSSQAPPDPGSSSLAKKKKKKVKKIVIEEEEDDDEEDIEGCEERSEDSEDEGSLVDFIVKEESGEEEEDDKEVHSEDDEGPCTLSKEDALKRDLDGIDTSNIIQGRRTRQRTQRYEETVFATEEYRKMMLCDVPDDEVEDALGDDEEEEDDDSEVEGDDEEDSDEDYEEEEEEEEEEEDDDDEEEGGTTTST